MVEPLGPRDPRQVGPYRLEGRLGAGGMGQVYLASSPGGRKVAVKVIRPELADTPQFRARFAREVDAARQVGGFHTAQVVDADSGAASPWLVTAYIPGPTLQQVVAENGTLSSDAVLRLGAGLAEGLAAIHRCGLVHRDLKPGNVILAEDGPRIIDFGVAHAPGAEAMTRTGTVIGTYAYMSPEQIRADRVSPASDVFALGSVLAFAASGRSPFDATTVPAIVHRVTSEPPVLDGLSGRLHVLVTACLAKDPAGRPSTAEVLNRLSVTGGSGDRAAPGVPFNDLPTEPGSGPGATPTPSPTPSPVVSKTSARRLPRRTLLFGGLAAGVTAAAVPGYLVWRGSGADPDPGKPVARLGGHTHEIGCLAFGPDGKTLASGGDDDTVRLWDVATGRTITTYRGHTDNVMSVAYAPDGRTLYSGGFDKTLRRWDLRTGRPMSVVASYTDEFGHVGSLAVSPDGATLAVGVANRVELVTVSTGRAFATLTGHGGSINDVVFSPDGKLVASVASETGAKIWLWAADTGRHLKKLTGESTDHFNAVLFSPDGKTVGGAGPGVQLWDLATGRPEKTLTDSHPYVPTAAYRPGSAVIAGAGGAREPNTDDQTGKTVSLWDVSTGSVSTTLTGVMPKSRGDTYITAVAFSPDGRTLAASLNQVAMTEESGHSIQLWKLP
ncbi:WD40 repeat domain-containing serine/threonine protein kinase [Streptomyces antarcticus]|uniref:WD40 repeat domain-containing serine/threonine protein kinase n=1 Tax=Streptomyces antarcticus TaxID=2996458 RepID=UPI00226EEBBF|nr:MULTISPECIES: serine/threonine-protein kinase [unclassified Streptomyces]MCY0939896.1 serine/threonine protein kinase [Streptomyces sp. H34-AA3]MCZ4081066.1 serine/threonine protein kinase [Streptomyces sp. H34-S5]